MVRRVTLAENAISPEFSPQYPEPRDLQSEYREAARLVEIALTEQRPTQSAIPNTLPEVRRNLRQVFENFFQARVQQGFIETYAEDGRAYERYDTASYVVGWLENVPIARPAPVSRARRITVETCRFEEAISGFMALLFSQTPSIYEPLITELLVLAVEPTDVVSIETMSLGASAYLLVVYRDRSAVEGVSGVIMRVSDSRCWPIDQILLAGEPFDDFSSSVNGGLVPMPRVLQEAIRRRNYR